MSSNQKVVIAVYGEEFKDVKPELFKDYLGVIEL
ncbi:hypothetical protein FOPG_17032 [Fusarium oxysporum f. sp. conglutinans race 2 54008]|uniref:Uncharacterized protein n=1 Tax=Fusarium oxysporum f. sp. conglutinans race 2 54008 TaxID=1089457 RepID=X0H4A3_FUSOX|nr:hypothetical protein FOPG_17032 [Fusarium oxysporum f. sp. conglutinans race 2 54008]